MIGICLDRVGSALLPCKIRFVNDETRNGLGVAITCCACGDDSVRG